MIIRSLKPEEWGVFAEFAKKMESDEPLPKQEHALVEVAELDGRIIGTISAEKVRCVSNLLIEREYRGSGIAERMARSIQARNTEGLSEMLSTTSHHVELLALNLGFIPIKGALWRR